MPIKDSSFYQLVNGETWEKAEQNAISLGGNLVTINSLEENKYLVSTFYGNVDVKNSSRQSAWIGFKDGSWSSGQSTSYTNWASGEGQTLGSEKYAEFLLIDTYNRDPGQWNDNSNPSSNSTVYGIAEVPLSYFSISDLSLIEGDSGTVTISRTGGTNTSQELSLVSSNDTATSGSDYSSITQTISFSKGEISKTISVSTIEDTTFESSESFKITLTASDSDSIPAQISDGISTITITDDDDANELTYNNPFHYYKFYNRGNSKYEIKNDDGFDDLTGIKTLKFTDKTVDVAKDIVGTFDQVTGMDDITGKTFRLYNAAFARFPDSDGLKYWIGKRTSGENSERVVAQSFLASAEFAERYGTDVTNAKYVETLYTNVLGRNYDQSGYNYWLGNLNAGTETRYELLLGFSESIENKSLFSTTTNFY
tara:strand:- start:995 stop:2269 length:1275 start_codon:yes stop_codon:yes gene_type:complete